MVAPTASPSTNAPSYGVSVRGRLFPSRLRDAAAAPLQQFERDRNREIAQRIWEQLPWSSREPDDLKDRKELVECYEASLNALRVRHQQVADLFLAACERNTEMTIVGSETSPAINQERKTQFIQSRYAQGDFRQFQPDNVLSAELLAEDLERIDERLDESLWQTTHALVQQVFAAMDRYVDKSVFGLIDWVNEETCKFHFFTETFFEQQERRAPQVEWTGSEELTTHRVDGRQLHTRQRHEHHLMEAAAHPVGAKQVVVPQAIQPIVEKIPDWLLPETRLVQGLQFRRDLVTQELRNRHWLREYVERREIRTHEDPAVVISGFVLTGWGEEEHLAELERRAVIATEQRRDALTPVFRSAVRRSFWLGAGGVIMWTAALLASLWLTPLAAALVAASIWQSKSALLAAARLHRVTATPGYLAAGMGGTICLWLGSGFLLAAAALWAPILIVPGVVLLGGGKILRELADDWLPVPVLTEVVF